MTAGESLLRAILETPADDLPRLVMADWLEEQGDRESVDRARLIRYQIESSASGLNDFRRISIRKSVSQLFRRNRKKWASPMSETDGRNFSWCPVQKIDGSWFGSRMSLNGFWQPYDTPGVQKWERGFVWYISGSLVALILNADRIFSRHPIETIEIDNALSFIRWEPTTSRWAISSSLPPCLLERMSPESMESANLSRLVVAIRGAFVSFARDAAGLPPLPAPAETAAHA
ncbi:TIGR02996 domain-containing protein [Fimbriiglobus ruber]|uniref:TIGR02996 domain-containing protein n=1 Tax=Fimbriiglobus ruber TaxID=1908690 RepID=UPI000B4AC830|nr:TIGR02996 domain-containing protein [Fimbriiglobus ruber]